jgi:hypothetical protein
MKSTVYFAHSANKVGHWHRLAAHLFAVSGLAGEFAAGTRWSEEARLAGLLHDLGKYGDLFQARLKGQESGLDHWSAGAWAVLKRQAIAATMAVQCRKLHRVQRAVVLFDDAQTLPVALAVLTLAALSHLSATYRSSIVFATAVQAVDAEDMVVAVGGDASAVLSVLDQTRARLAAMLGQIEATEAVTGTLQ